MKKLICIILSAMILFSSCITGAYASSFSDGYAVVSSVVLGKLSEKKTDVLSLIKSGAQAFSMLSDKKLLPDNNLDIEFNDGIVRELCGYIKENSDLDIECIFNNIPLGAKGLKFVYEITNTDTTAIRDSIYALRSKCDEKKLHVLSTIFYFLGAYLSGIEKVNVYTKPVDKKGTSQVALDITYVDGSTETLAADIFFSRDGVAYGSDGKGILGLGYECSVYDLMIYATVDSWMRSFGFSLLYDIFCYTTPFFNYITRRFRFDYDGKEWMIQVWKGNYVVTNGAEVGIYNRNKGSIGSYYSCYDGVMDMSLKLSHGDGLIFDRHEQHWWINGFKLAKHLYSPAEMTLEFSISFPDEGMANAFAKAVQNDPVGDMSCEIGGKTVSVVWC